MKPIYLLLALLGLASCADKKNNTVTPADTGKIIGYQISSSAPNYALYVIDPMKASAATITPIPSQSASLPAFMDDSSNYYIHAAYSNFVLRTSLKTGVTDSIFITTGNVGSLTYSPVTGKFHGFQMLTRYSFIIDEAAPKTMVAVDSMASGNMLLNYCNQVIAHPAKPLLYLTFQQLIFQYNLSTGVLDVTSCPANGHLGAMVFRAGDQSLYGVMHPFSSSGLSDSLFRFNTETNTYTSLMKLSYKGQTSAACNPKTNQYILEQSITGAPGSLNILSRIHLDSLTERFSQQYPYSFHGLIWVEKIEH